MYSHRFIADVYTFIDKEGRRQTPWSRAAHIRLHTHAGADQGSDRELVLERGQFWNKFWRGAIFIKKYPYRGVWEVLYTTLVGPYQVPHIQIWCLGRPSPFFICFYFLFFVFPLSFIVLCFQNLNFLETVLFYNFEYFQIFDFFQKVNIFRM
jgi:hypothetical protein